MVCARSDSRLKFCLLFLHMRFSTAPPRVRRLVGCEILEQIEREKKKRCTLCFLHKSTPYTKVERLTDIPRKFARKKNGNYSRPPSSYSLGYLGGHTSLLLICSVRKGHMIEDDSSRSNHGDSPSLSASLTEHSISQWAQLTRLLLHCSVYVFVSCCFFYRWTGGELLPVAFAPYTRCKNVHAGQKTHNSLKRIHTTKLSF